ncbi:MAG: hypothetical protein NTV52_32545 [Acidobacteria bacterium]|nr:hypothetical protein [Acidobacteriota bacterium]
MKGSPQSLSAHAAFHLALIACVCVVMVLFSGSAPTRLGDTGWLTRQIDDRVEQIEAPNHTTVPMVPLDIRFAEGHLKDVVEEVAELPEPTDDDETEYCLVRLDVAAFAGQPGLYGSSAYRAISSFRLRAFSSRGSPSA